LLELPVTSLQIPDSERSHVITVSMRLPQKSPRSCRLRLNMRGIRDRTMCAAKDTAGDTS
jgi:hypothetical protein